MQDHSTPPALASEACERSAVAALLLGDVGVGELARDMLSCPRELAVYDAAVAISDRGTEISPFAVRDYMGDRAALVGGSDIEWGEYCDAAPIPTLRKSVLSALRYYRRRRAQSTLADRIQAADPTNLAEILRQGMLALEQPEARGQAKTLVDAGADLVLEMNTPGRRVPVPWPRVHAEIGSIGAGEVCALAALPGGGKSAMAQQWAEHAARNGHPVLYLSLEMLASQLAMRMVSRCERINGRLLLLGGADRIASVEVSIRRHAPRNLRVIDDLSDVEALSQATASWVDQLTDEGPAPLVVIDHLQHLHGADKFERLDAAIRLCTETAKRHRVAVLALSQFANKDIGAKRPPNSSDLWGGMALWQAASTVLLLSESGDRRAPVRSVTMTVDKARNGTPGGEIALRFEGRYATFTEDTDNAY